MRHVKSVSRRPRAASRFRHRSSSKRTSRFRPRVRSARRNTRRRVGRSRNRSSSRGYSKSFTARVMSALSPPRIWVNDFQISVFQTSANITTYITPNPLLDTPDCKALCAATNYREGGGSGTLARSFRGARTLLRSGFHLYEIQNTSTAPVKLVFYPCAARRFNVPYIAGDPVYGGLQTFMAAGWSATYGPTVDVGINSVATSTVAVQQTDINSTLYQSGSWTSAFKIGRVKHVTLPPGKVMRYKMRCPKNIMLNSSDYDDNLPSSFLVCKHMRQLVIQMTGTMGLDPANGNCNTNLASIGIITRERYEYANMFNNERSQSQTYFMPANASSGVTSVPTWHTVSTTTNPSFNPAVGE